MRAVYNTGVSEGRARDLVETCRAFFHLPRAWKQAVKMRRTVSNPGWDAPRSERVAPNANPDFKDVIDRGRPVSLESVCRHRGRSVDTPSFWPDRTPEFRTVVQTYSTDACAVAMRVLGTIASAVGRDAARFDGTFKTPVALLRGNHHPKRPDWAGEKDFGIALPTDHG